MFSTHYIRSWCVLSVCLLFAKATSDILNDSTSSDSETKSFLHNSISPEFGDKGYVHSNIRDRLINGMLKTLNANSKTNYKLFRGNIIPKGEILFDLNNFVKSGDSSTKYLLVDILGNSNKISLSNIDIVGSNIISKEDIKLSQKELGRELTFAVKCSHLGGANLNFSVYLVRRSFTLRCLENITASTIITTLNISSTNLKISFENMPRILSSYVGINSTSIFILNSLDYEIKPDVFHFHMSLNNVKVTQIDVHVLDVNDQIPMFEQFKYKFSLFAGMFSEDIGQVTVVDLDTVGHVTYQVVDEPPSVLQQRCTIHGQIGDIPVVIADDGKLKFECPLTYRHIGQTRTVMVSAFDGAHFALRDAEVTVEVKKPPINTSDPQWMIFEGEITSKTLKGTMISSVTSPSFTGFEFVCGNNLLCQELAVDKDTGYVSLLKEGHGVVKELSKTLRIPVIGRQINSSDVRQKSLIYKNSTFTECELNVVLGTLLLYINDIDLDIVRHPGVVTVREDAGIGTVVLWGSLVTFTDDHSIYRDYTKFNLHISLTNASKFPFEVDVKTGDVFVTDLLDREIVEEYILTIIISAAQRFAELSVIVKIADVNDQVPVFEAIPKQYTIDEDAPLGKLLTVNAKDKDIGENAQIMFNIVNGSAGHFFIDKKTGDISLIKTLDWEETRVYILFIAAWDNGVERQNVALARVDIQVNNVDDQCPLFAESYRLTEIPENYNCSPNNPVVSWKITNPESVSKFGVTFDIQNQGPFFTFHNRSELFCVMGSLDYEKQAEYRVKVHVKTKNLSRKCETSVLTIDVILRDINDNMPEFTNQIYDTFVSTAMIKTGAAIAQVKAVDKDSGDNGRVSYTISRTSNQMLMVRIDKHGIVYVTHNTKPGPDSSKGPKFTSHCYTITATDHGNPQRSSSTHLRISFENNERSAMNPVIGQEININVDKCRSENIALFNLVDIFVKPHHRTPASKHDGSWPQGTSNHHSPNHHQEERGHKSRQKRTYDNDSTIKSSYNKRVAPIHSGWFPSSNIKSDEAIHNEDRNHDHYAMPSHLPLSEEPCGFVRAEPSSGEHVQLTHEEDDTIGNKGDIVKDRVNLEVYNFWYKIAVILFRNSTFLNPRPGVPPLTLPGRTNGKITVNKIVKDLCFEIAFSEAVRENHEPFGFSWETLAKFIQWYVICDTTPHFERYTHTDQLWERHRQKLSTLSLRELSNKISSVTISGIAPSSRCMNLTKSGSETQTYRKNIDIFSVESIISCISDSLRSFINDYQTNQSFSNGTFSSNNITLFEKHGNAGLQPGFGTMLERSTHNAASHNNSRPRGSRPHRHPTAQSPLSPSSTKFEFTSLVPAQGIRISSDGTVKCGISSKKLPQSETVLVNVLQVLNDVKKIPHWMSKEYNPGRMVLSTLVVIFRYKDTSILSTNILLPPSPVYLNVPENSKPPQILFTPLFGDVIESHPSDLNCSMTTRGSIDGTKITPFAVLTHNCSVLLTYPLDHEQQSLYHLQLNVSDKRHTLFMGSPIEVIIHVTDVNEYAPQFSQVSFNFSLSQLQRSDPECEFTVSDKDSNDYLHEITKYRYSTVATSDGVKCPLSIEDLGGNQGRFYSQPDVNIPDDAPVTCIVTVQDGDDSNMRTGIAIVTVTVDNLNSCIPRIKFPPGFQEEGLTVIRGHAENETVLVLDVEYNYKGTKRLNVSHNGCNFITAAGISNNNIALTITRNISSSTSYCHFSLVLEGDENIQSKPFVIPVHVVDNSDDFFFPTNYHEFTVEENEPIEFVIHPRVVTYIRDRLVEQKNVQYTLIDEVGLFSSITTPSGDMILRSNNTIDREKVGDEIEVYILAKGNHHNDTLVIHIRVDDKNDCLPYFNQTIYTFHVEHVLYDDTPNSELNVIGHIMAKDDDSPAFSLIRYSLITGSTHVGVDVLTIGEDSGAINLNTSALEYTHFYNRILGTIIATDEVSGGLSAGGVASIEVVIHFVEDISYSVNVDCGARPGTVIEHILPSAMYTIAGEQNSDIWKKMPYALNTTDNTIYLKYELNETVSSGLILIFSMTERHGYWIGNYQVTVMITGRSKNVIHLHQDSANAQINPQISVPEVDTDSLKVALVTTIVLLLVTICILTLVFLRWRKIMLQRLANKTMNRNSEPKKENGKNPPTLSHHENGEDRYEIYQTITELEDIDGDQWTEERVGRKVVTSVPIEEFDTLEQRISQSGHRDNSIKLTNSSWYSLGKLNEGCLDCNISTTYAFPGNHTSDRTRTERCKGTSIFNKDDTFSDARLSSSISVRTGDCQNDELPPEPPVDYDQGILSSASSHKDIFKYRNIPTSHYSVDPFQNFTHNTNYDKGFDNYLQKRFIVNRDSTSYKNTNGLINGVTELRDDFHSGSLKDGLSPCFVNKQTARKTWQIGDTGTIYDQCMISEDEDQDNMYSPPSRDIYSPISRHPILILSDSISDPRRKILENSPNSLDDEVVEFSSSESGSTRSTHGVFYNENNITENHDSRFEQSSLHLVRKRDTLVADSDKDVDFDNEHETMSSFV